jgi:phenylalanyl-tRNA synthetase alpha chain
MSTDLTQVQKQFENDLNAADSLEAVEQLRQKYLGRKQGLMTLAFTDLAKAAPEEKRQRGPKLNQLKQQIEQALNEKDKSFGQSREHIDLTIPPLKRPTGHLHPITLVQQELEDIFHGLGFATVFSQEVESDWYNFTALNIPPHHPARDMQDTFYIDSKSGGGKTEKDQLVLRTHTSSGQIRFMQQYKPPFAIIVPGRVFRNEATDATHEHTFQQMDGLVVGEDITYANMVWLLQRALSKFFGPEVKVKIVPSYFPFVEPGAEVAISHPKFEKR